MSKHKDSFAGDGFEPFPGIYEDNKRVGECSNWDNARLTDTYVRYQRFAEGDLMPRAREQATRILGHLSWEMSQRFDLEALKNLDESCEGA